MAVKTVSKAISEGMDAFPGPWKNERAATVIPVAVTASAMPTAISSFSYANGTTKGLSQTAITVAAVVPFSRQTQKPIRTCPKRGYVRLSPPADLTVLPSYA